MESTATTGGVSEDQVADALDADAELVVAGPNRDLVAVLEVIGLDRAARYLAEYFGLARRVSGNPEWADAGAYTGAYFGTVAEDGAHPNQLTAGDLIAVSMLSVTVPAGTARRLLMDPPAAIARVLAAHPVGLSMESADEDVFSEGSSLQELWNAVRYRDSAKTKWGIGPTTASKILARKRPALIPIQDSVVNRLLGVSDRDTWTYWWDALHHPGPDGAPGENPAVAFAAKAREAALSTNSSSGERDALANLSTLRTLDVILWMYGFHDSTGPGEVEDPDGPQA